MNWRGISLALFITIVQVACGVSTTPEGLIAEAKTYRAKKDLDAALIQAKNAVQLAPDLAEAHYIKGVICMDMGDPHTAEGELRQAMSLGMDPRDVIPVLARALVAQDKFDDALDETFAERYPGAADSAELMTLRGDAYAGIHRIPAARVAYESALKIESEYPAALLGLAKITAAAGRTEEGLRLVGRVLVNAPGNHDALLLQGDLYRIVRDPNAALTSYESAVREKPNAMNARLSLASLQIALEKDVEAATNLAVVLAAAPHSPTANYLQGLVEFRKKNFTAAQNHAVEVLKVQPTHYPSVVLAGACEYAAGEFSRAVMHLQWALDLNPKSLYVRKLLVASYAKERKLQPAIETLEAGLKQTLQDPDLLALAGDVYMQANQFELATSYYDRALGIQPNSVGNRVAANASRLALGDSDRVVADLEPLVAANPAQAKAGVILAMAQIRRGQFDEALRLIAPLEKELPSNPIVLNLKGGAYLGKKDAASAKRAFEQALARQGSFFPAAANLAQLDISVGDYAMARKRYEAILDSDGGNAHALLAIADLINREPGKSEEAMRWVERARALQPNDPRVALILARYQLAKGNAATALELARRATKTAEFDAKVLEDALQLQLAAGAMDDAIATYNKYLRLRSPSAETAFRLASMEYLAGKQVIAKQTLARALDLDPDMQDALTLLAKLEASTGNRDAALKLVERVRKRAPNSPSTFVLEGDVEMLAKRYSTAAKAYERAYSRAKRGNLAAQIHQAYLRAGKPEQGESVVLGWLQENPTDNATRQYFADASLRASRFAVAIPHYEFLAESQPRNQQVLNNLAWAYDQTSDPRALAIAEKSFRLNEANPLAADTYGWILFRNLRIPESADVLRTALASWPDSQEIRYHYAQVLAKSGERKAARAEVQRLLNATPPFARQAEAKILLDQLKN